MTTAACRPRCQEIDDLRGHLSGSEVPSRTAPWCPYGAQAVPEPNSDVVSAALRDRVRTEFASPRRPRHEADRGSPAP